MMEPASFQWCPVTGPEAVGTNWNTGRSLWTSGNTFLLKGDQALAQAAREVVKSPSLEIFRSHLDMVLGNLLEQGVGQDDLQRSISTLTLLWLQECILLSVKLSFCSRLVPWSKCKLGGVVLFQGR